MKVSSTSFFLESRNEPKKVELELFRALAQALSSFYASFGDYLPFGWLSIAF